MHLPFLTIRHLFMLHPSLQDIMEHQEEFFADREEARCLRLASLLRSSDDLYECDDKCGSWWLRLPVLPGGRDRKDLVKYSYHFAIQSNSIHGANGVMRFSVVPKHVQTGVNFGLTNLLMAIYR